MTTPFLLSIDLEDLRTRPGGEAFPDHVRETTREWLAFLDAHDVRCTFFTVGDVARNHPELLREIRERGHEVGCHSSAHENLDQHDAASFRDDVARNLDDLASAGVDDVVGYRAPTLSLTAERAFAHGVLRDLGFRYSSSVLPAGNPLYGWPGFGREPRRVEGLWELPVSLSGLPLLDVPFAAGVYFRVLPFALVRHLFRRELGRGRPVVSYFHPYDIDTRAADARPRPMHPGIGGSRFYNGLLYRNRHRVLERLGRLLDEGVRVRTYREHVARDLEDGSPA